MILEGNNIELVEIVLNSAALIQQATAVKNRVSENFGMVFIFLKKEQFSRLMNKS